MSLQSETRRVRATVLKGMTDLRLSAGNEGNTKPVKVGEAAASPCSLPSSSLVGRKYSARWKVHAGRVVK